MGSRPINFPTTDQHAYDGKARIYRIQEMLRWPPPEWLIDGLIPKGKISCIYAQPGVGKSMLALDWGLCVAAGLPWHGRAVKQGYVLYLAAEGSSGQAKRAAAWLKHHNLTDVAEFGMVKEQIPITTLSPDYDALFDRIADELQKTPTLVIIDTLARCIEGDENESVAMGNFVTGAERWMKEHGSTVLVVHHSNAQGGRERGHSIFKGALETLMRLTKENKRGNILRLETPKQRDAEPATDIGLEFCPIEGTDSVVFVPCELPSSASEAGQREPAVMRKVDMLKVLAVAEDGFTWQEWRLASGIGKPIFNRRLRRLIADGEIFKDGIRYYAYPALADVADTEPGSDLNS